MSRRTAGADRTAQNLSTLKSLVKLEGNKSCADCKKNKRMKYHNRDKWAEADRCWQTQDGPAGTWASSSASGKSTLLKLKRSGLADNRCRCSGIHRGMGTHISRVKSVDLDSWTDEQLQSMLKWGNTRANKYVLLTRIALSPLTKPGRYWEAKLAPGHVPAEA